MTAATAQDFDTSPYFETVAREFFRNFGSDALDVIDRAIEALESPGSRQGGPETLDMWRMLRVTLLRKSAAHAPVTIQ